MIAPLVVGIVHPRDVSTSCEADIVEARFDLMTHPESAFEICRSVNAQKPILATIRLATDGGMWNAIDDRRGIFEKAIYGGVCSWIDIEADSDLAPVVIASARASNVRVIVSHHDFAETPTTVEFEEIIDRAQALKPDIIKIAAHVRNLWDHDRLIALAQRQRNDLAVIGMGPLGAPLRTYLPCIGSRLAYGYLSRSLYAPGMPSVNQLVERLTTDCPDFATKRDLPKIAAPGTQTP